MQHYEPIAYAYKTFNELYHFCYESINNSNSDFDSLADKRDPLLKQLTNLFIQKVLTPVEDSSLHHLKHTLQTFEISNTLQVQNGSVLLLEKLKNFPKNYIWEPKILEEELIEARATFLRKHRSYDKQSFYRNKLSNYLMKKCFSYLSVHDVAKVSQVNRYFEALTDEIKAQYHALDLFHLPLNDGNFKYIVQQCPNLTAMSFPPNFPSSDSLHYINYFPKLTELRLKDNLLIEDGAFEMLHPSPTLKVLDLENTAIQTPTIKNLLAELSELRFLNLSYLSILDSGDLISSINKASKLVSLNLAGCQWIMSQSFFSFETNPNLQSLNLSKTKIEKQFLKKLEGLFPNLISLNLAYCSQLNLDDLEPLKNLKRLMTISSFGIRPTTTPSSVVSKQVTVRASLANINGKTPELLLQASKYSRFIEFKFCSDLQKETLLSLKYLNHIDFSFATIENHDLKALNQLPSLEILVLNRCLKLTDEACAYIAQYKKLVYLDLSGCYRLTNRAVKNLSVAQTLEGLDLSYCTDLTDYSPLSKLSRLRTLYLKNCAQLDDQAISTLEKLTYLNTLILQECPKATSKSLESLNRLKYVHVLGLVNLPLLKQEDVMKYDLHHPQSILILTNSLYTVPNNVRIMLHPPALRQFQERLLA